MGWGTSFKPELYISKQIYKDLDDLNYDIKELDDVIKSLEAKILMYASANPKDIVQKDSDDIISDLQCSISILLDDYKEIIETRYLLTQLSENFDTIIDAS